MRAEAEGGGRRAEGGGRRAEGGGRRAEGGGRRAENLSPPAMRRKADRKASRKAPSRNRGPRLGRSETPARSGCACNPHRAALSRSPRHAVAGSP
ncbi:hypothetical protein E2976_16395 [Paracoccus yeei]